MDLAPGEQFGRYKIELLIGKGGMGEVYRARDTQLKRDVALKILPAQWRNSAVLVPKRTRVVLSQRRQQIDGRGCADLPHV
jgi:hypothetical protein